MASGVGPDPGICTDFGDNLIHRHQCGPWLWWATDPDTALSSSPGPDDSKATRSTTGQYGPGSCKSLGLQHGLRWHPCDLWWEHGPSITILLILFLQLKNQLGKYGCDYIYVKKGKMEKFHFYGIANYIALLLNLGIIHEKEQRFYRALELTSATGTKCPAMENIMPSHQGSLRSTLANSTQSPGCGK